jgi:formyl-CoA transferase
MGSAYPATAPSGLHPCHPGGANDYVYVLIASNGHWEAILRAIGREDLLGDPRYARQSARNAREEEVSAILREWTRRHDKIEAMERLAGFGVPCGAVLDTSELLANPQLRESGMVVEHDHPEWGRIWIPACPIRIDGAAARIEPAPPLGRDTEEIARAADQRIARREKA